MDSLHMANLRRAGDRLAEFHHTAMSEACRRASFRIEELERDLARANDALRQANSVRDIFAAAVVRSVTGEGIVMQEPAAESQRRDEVEKDAARYRWLRGGAPPHSERWSRWDLKRWDGRFWHSLELGALDAAIDAAMKD